MPSPPLRTRARLQADSLGALASPQALQAAAPPATHPFAAVAAAQVVQAAQVASGAATHSGHSGQGGLLWQRTSSATAMQPQTDTGAPPPPSPPSLSPGLHSLRSGACERAAPPTPATLRSLSRMSAGAAVLQSPALQPQGAGLVPALQTGAAAGSLDLQSLALHVNAVLRPLAAESTRLFRGEAAATPGAPVPAPGGSVMADDWVRALHNPPAGTFPNRLAARGPQRGAQHMLRGQRPRHLRNADFPGE